PSPAEEPQETPVENPTPPEPVAAEAPAPQPDPLPQVEEAPLAPEPEVTLPKETRPEPEPEQPKKVEEKKSEEKPEKKTEKKADPKPAPKSDSKQQQKAAASAAGKFDPNPIYRASPAYPASARASKLQGAVVVAYSVSPSGAVTNVRVVSANPPGIFNAATLAAVRQWRFKPSPSGGSRTTTVRFKLK
ncbi:MAG: TonB family protein, partial [Tardiphaga sp.]